MRARLAAHHLHATIADPAAHTAPSRAAFLSRFEREVDPEGVLEPRERARRTGARPSQAIAEPEPPVRLAGALVGHGGAVPTEHLR